MSLRSLFDELDAQRRTITIYTADTHPEVAEHFEQWNVSVRFDGLPETADAGFVTVRQGDEFLGSVDISVLSALLEPTVTSVPVSEDTDQQDIQPLLELLDDTLFQSFERRQLLAASREVEDRAWRVGDGRLQAGFQRPAAFEAQRSIYERLAKRGLDVHTYVGEAWDPDPIPGVTTHTERGELGQFWFVAFDGGGDDAQSCSLLAEERESGYTGFWSYDPARVSTLDDYLVDSYW